MFFKSFPKANLKNYIFAVITSSIMICFSLAGYKLAKIYKINLENSYKLIAASLYDYIENIENKLSDKFQISNLI